MRRTCHKLKHVAFLVAFLAPVVSTWAQVPTVRFEHLTINDGLSQSSVNALLEDDRGFLWVGTQDGLNRFDGYRFDILRHVANDPASLASNNISSLYEDSDHSIWVGTEDGTLHRYDRDTESFLRFRLPADTGAELTPQFSHGIRQILETSDGRFWVGTRNRGLVEFDRQSGQFHGVPGLEKLKINRIVERSRGELWVGTDQKGLLWFYPESGEIVDAGDVQANEQVFVITGTRQGETWVAGSGGHVTRYASDRSIISQFSTALANGIQNYDARAMIEDSDGRIWIGFIGGGLQVFADDANRLATFLHSPSDNFSLSTDTVFSLLLDRSGVLWAGSLAAGLSKANVAGGRFTNYWHKPEDPNSLGDNMVHEFAEDQRGGIWIGTNGGGVDFFDPDIGTFVHYRSVPGDSATLSSDSVWGMHLGNAGDLWVGTWGSGLNRLDIATGTVERYPINALAADALPGAIVTSIVDDGAGGIWIGMADGGLVRKPATQRIFERHYLFDNANEEAQPANVASMYRDRAGRLWVGTWAQGLCMLQSPGSRFGCYTYDPTNERSINDNNIRAINEDHDGMIWVATGNGIARFDENTRTFDRVTAAEGLVDGVIYGIIPAEKDILWLSSNHGLMHFDASSGDVRKYVYKDGLQANEFNGESFLRSSDGTLYFGGIGGITSFRPEKLVNNPVSPKVVITQFNLSNKPVSINSGKQLAVLAKPIMETKSLNLNFDQNFFGFEFAGLHFVSPDLNRYAYMLVGFDPDWVHTDATRRFATYTNVDPGQYAFHVRASNSDGIWSAQDAVVDITILPPWWMTWWARLTFAVVTVLSILSFIRWRLSQLRAHTQQLDVEVRHRTEQILKQKDTIAEQAAYLEEVLAAKNRFFARLSHEFRTPITLMLGPIDEQLEQAIPDRTRHGLSMARRNGHRLLHLVDQLLGLARYSEKQSVTRAPIALAPVATIVIAGFDSAARKKNLELLLHTDPEVWVESDYESLQTILINLVSNSVKYTPNGGRIAVDVTTKDGTAVIRVSDTGIGVANSNLRSVFNIFERGTATGPGSGIGLTLVKELVDAHEGTITLDSTPGKGTTVEIRLAAVPVAQDIAADGKMALPDVDQYIAAPETIANSGLAGDVHEPHLPHVLIIEDNSDMRAYVMDLLAADCHCSEAQDGHVGLEQARKSIPDLVVCDVMMPEIGGFEVLHELRNDERTSHIPVIMLTALGDQTSRLKGLEERADDYISKPFDRRELRLRVRNLLELCHLRAQRAGQAVYARDVSCEVGVAIPEGLTERDRKFLSRFDRLIQENYQNADFHMDSLADDLFMSERQLQRKLKAILDTVPTSYLRDYRLKKAREMLLAGKAVTDVAFASGFSSPGYFGKCYKARFDMPPSDVRPH